MPPASAEQRLIPAVVGNPRTIEAPKVPKTETVTSIIVDFHKTEENRSLTVADFQRGDGAVLNDTPINLITTSRAKGHELKAIGANGVELSSSNASGPFMTNKGTWKTTPILKSYIFTEKTLSASDHPTLEISGLDNIPTAATITLTIWGVGDTPDSDAAFQLVYNGAPIAKKTTDYDAAEVNTRVQFTFNKIDGADDLKINWGKAGSSIAGLSGFSLVARVTQ